MATLCTVCWWFLILFYTGTTRFHTISTMLGVQEYFPNYAMPYEIIEQLVSVNQNVIMCSKLTWH